MLFVRYKFLHIEHNTLRTQFSSLSLMRVWHLSTTQQYVAVSNLHCKNCSGAPSVDWNSHFTLAHLVSAWNSRTSTNERNERENFNVFTKRHHFVVFGMSYGRSFGFEGNLPSIGFSSNKKTVGKENTKLSNHAITTRTLARFPETEGKACFHICMWNRGIRRCNMNSTSKEGWGIRTKRRIHSETITFVWHCWKVYQLHRFLRGLTWAHVVVL